MKIANKDKVRCFDFLSEFENTIKRNFGSYNISDNHLRQFLNENRIFLGKTNKSDRAAALKSKYYIVFEQKKPRNGKNDKVHHLLRHIRNAMAHGHITKTGRDEFHIEDMKESGIITMEGNIGKKEFFMLLEQLKKTRA